MRDHRHRIAGKPLRGHRHRHGHGHQIIDIWKDYLTVNHPEYDEGLPVLGLPGSFLKGSGSVGPVHLMQGALLPADLHLLDRLAAISQSCSYFEIMAFRGESLAHMARKTCRCYSLSRSVGEVRKQGLRRKYHTLLGYYPAGPENVVHFSGDSLTFDFLSLDRKFDLVFIDGRKSHDDVMHDSEAAVKYLIHHESVIVWHDYTDSLGRVQFEVLAGLLDGISPSMHREIYHIRQTKCAVWLPGEQKDKLGRTTA